MTQGYGQVPPQHGPHYGATIIGLVIGTAGLLIMLVFGHNYSTCQSLLGQLAQGTDAAARAACSGAAIAHWGGLLALIGGGLTFAIGLMVMLGSTRSQPQPLPPALLPWQDVPCARCGASASAHSQTGCPVCTNCGQPAAAHIVGRCPPSAAQADTRSREVASQQPGSSIPES